MAIKLCQSILASLLISTLVSCVNDEIQQSDIQFFNVYMEYDATNKSENSLIFTSPSDEFLYSISGINLVSTVEFNTKLPLQAKTTFQAQDEGEYSIDVKVYLNDGTLYHEKKLSWLYDKTIPLAPVVGFNQQATNNGDVLLLVSSNRSPNVDQLWIQGDLAESDSPEGDWRDIPSTGIIPLSISEGDGDKFFKVKTKNKANIESEVVTLSLQRKDSSPEGCFSYSPKITRDKLITMEVTAVDQGPLFYRVFGDTVNDSQFHEFTDQVQFEVELTSSHGMKDITVQIKDSAENHCLKNIYQILLDENYSEGKVNIKDNLLTTDTGSISVNLSYDSLPSDFIEVYLYGGILSGDNAEVWMPYTTDDIAVTLAPAEGHRWVRAKFRKNGVESNIAWAGVFLKPFIYLQGSSAPYQILLSDIIGLDRLSIFGCNESYDNISYGQNLLCNPTAATIEVLYILQDGTEIRRSVEVGD